MKLSSNVNVINQLTYAWIDKPNKNPKQKSSTYKNTKVLMERKARELGEKKFSGLIAPNNIINKNSCNIQAK